MVELESEIIEWGEVGLDDNLDLIGGTKTSGKFVVCSGDGKAGGTKLVEDGRDILCE